MSELQKLPISAQTEDIVEIVQRDGALILTDAIAAADLAALNAELAPYMAATPAGRDDFTGRATTRTGALVARSPKTRELVMNQPVLDAVGAFLKPYCHRFQLHLTQIIRLMPGQGKQAIHRDRWAWGKYMKDIEPQLNTIWALTDFTEENGATQVVPGSVGWPDDRQAQPEEICQAVMPAGSLLLYSGSVFHAGGENRSNEDRVGLNITYSLGWLRQEENQFLSCPPEIARDLEPALQDLLGYSMGSYALGYYTPPLPPGEGPEIVSPEHAVGRKAGQMGEADAELLESLKNS